MHLPFWLSFCHLIWLFGFSVTDKVRAQSLAQRIDSLIAATPEYDKNAAVIASDTEFLRRMYLDLHGTIPSSVEVRSFLADSTSNKREKRMEQLLQQPEYARHMQQTFDVWLMDRRADVRVPRKDWEDFLRMSFAQNKPYDQLIRDLLAADGADPKTRAAAKFFLDREMDLTQVTRDISRLFLGRNIQCAQCHDHPNVSDYFQSHFYGLQAFLTRSYLFPDARNPAAVLAEKAEGEASYSNVFDKNKLVKTAPPSLLGGQPIAEPKLEKGKAYKVAPTKKDVKPVPEFSRRAQLPGLLTAPDNEAFRRTSANRFWFHLFGRGLIQPIDFDHSDNPPSHPELLDLLGKEFAEHKWDVKWFLKEIMLSKTYQRSSELPASMQTVEPEQYRVTSLQPLAPEQFASAILQATGFTDSVRLGLGKEATEEKVQAQLAGNLRAIVGKFANRPGEPVSEDWQASLDQTLFLKHNSLMRSLIAVRKGNLLDRLLQLKEANAILDELFLSILTRFPTEEERKDLHELLQSCPDRSAALSEMIWALIATAEFRFKH